MRLCYLRNSWLKRHAILHLLVAVFVFAAMPRSATAADKTLHPYQSLAVSDFYETINNRLFWFGDSLDNSLRQQLILQLEHCATLGLNPEDYQIDALKASLDIGHASPDTVIAADHLYTTAALTYLSDVLKGNMQNGITGSDALAVREDDTDRQLVTRALLACNDPRYFDSVVTMLEPATQEYTELKNALTVAHGQDSIALLRTALNSYRRIHHLHYARCVVVNIPSGLLRYYEQDSLMLEMNVVAGKPATPTPRFSAYCNEVILYPYWNVPRSIAVNEILPFCKSNPAILSLMNMQVLDAKGRVVDARSIKWKDYNKNNFPYRFRQSTGCDNALGVMKFNLDSPYGVYLHDTNFKSAFAAKKRYFSHGCIRIEKPVVLADLLLDTAIDSTMLKACLKEELPKALRITVPVPVFVVYVRAGIDAKGRLMFYDDVYGLRQ